MAASLKLFPGSTVRWCRRRQANADLWVGRNARIVTNPADPVDSPEQGITGEVVNRIDGIHHPQIIAESRSLKGAFGTRHVGPKLAPATKFPAQACAAICT